MNRTITAFGCLLLLACGSSDSSNAGAGGTGADGGAGAPADGGAGASACTFAITGSYTATGVCDVSAVNGPGLAPGLTYSIAGDHTVADGFHFAFTADKDETAPAVGSYPATAFNNATTDVQTVADPNNGWEQLSGSGADASTGTATFTINTVGDETDGPTTKSWFGLHGTFDADLPPDVSTGSTATGPVHVHVDF